MLHHVWPPFYEKKPSPVNFNFLAVFLCDRMVVVSGKRWLPLWNFLNVIQSYTRHNPRKEIYHKHRYICKIF